MEQIKKCYYDCKIGFEGKKLGEKWVWGKKVRGKMGLGEKKLGEKS